MRWEEASGGQKAASLGCLGVLFVLFLVVLFTCTGSGSTSSSRTETASVPCISALNGRQTVFANEVKRRLVDPGSFRHVETWYSTGAYPRTVVMKYTARNRAGVIVNATARGTYERSCAVEVETIE